MEERIIQCLREALSGAEGVRLSEAEAEDGRLAMCVDALLPLRNDQGETSLVTTSATVEICLEDGQLRFTLTDPDPAALMLPNWDANGRFVSAIIEDARMDDDDDVRALFKAVVGNLRMRPLYTYLGEAVNLEALAWMTGGEAPAGERGDAAERSARPAAGPSGSASQAGGAEPSGATLHLRHDPNARQRRAVIKMRHQEGATPNRRAPSTSAGAQERSVVMPGQSEDGTEDCRYRRQPGDGRMPMSASSRAPINLSRRASQRPESNPGDPDAGTFDGNHEE